MTLNQQLTWTDVDGNVTPLTAEFGIHVQWHKGTVGLDGSSIDLRTEPRLRRGGSALLNRRVGEQRIAVPLALVHPVRVRTLQAELEQIFQGPGILSLSDAVQTRHRHDVVFNGNLQPGSRQYRSPTATEAVATFTALDPWWYDDTPQSLTVTDFTVTTPTDSPLIATDDPNTPTDGGQSLAETVAGDDAASPVTTLTGPFTALTISISPTLRLDLANPLTAGDTLTIDTRAGRRGYRLNDGPINWSLLTPASGLFDLPTGPLTVTIGASGTTPGQSAVRMEWVPRWRTP